MKLKEYNEVIGKLSELNITDGPRSVRHLFPGVPEKTLWNIYSQFLQRKTIQRSKEFYHKKQAEECYGNFKKAQKEGKKHPGIIMRMARDIDLAPALLCRIILEKFLTEKEGQKPSKETMREMKDDPSLIPDPVLAREVVLCHTLDWAYGPHVDVFKRKVGSRYEDMLEEQLRELKISFMDELKLRQKGYDKTPDVLLTLPMLVRGKPIYWIESKASFGDIENHARYKKDQLQCYWNRFGPGMVIYWFGFVEELDIDSGVRIYDHLPVEEIVYYDTSPYKLKYQRPTAEGAMQLDADEEKATEEDKNKDTDEDKDKDTDEDKDKGTEENALNGWKQ